MTSRSRKLALLVCLAVLVSAPGASAEDSDDALRRLTLQEAEQTPGIFDAYDPWEGMNRRVYVFNARFDQYVFLPAVRGYEFILPGFARKGISNVFTQLDDVTTLANSILQLSPRKTGGTLARLVVNLTAGVAGLWDAATHFGLPKYDEDFGQTLGHYRVPQGPYFVVPILGPSSLREFTGELVDRVPFAIFGVPPIYVTPVEAVGTRADNPFRYGDIGPPFEYDMVRTLSLKRRQLMTGE